jgi:hypothetical protein
MRLIILPLLLFALTAQAEVYRWVDSQGKMHFGDQPPPELGHLPKAEPAKKAKDKAGKKEDSAEAKEETSGEATPQKTKADDKKAATKKKPPIPLDELLQRLRQGAKRLEKQGKSAPQAQKPSAQEDKAVNNKSDFAAKEDMPASEGSEKLPAPAKKAKAAAANKQPPKTHEATPIPAPKKPKAQAATKAKPKPANDTPSKEENKPAIKEKGEESEATKEDQRKPIIPFSMDF